jgi:hypothetical protein
MQRVLSGTWLNTNTEKSKPVKNKIVFIAIIIYVKIQKKLKSG